MDTRQFADPESAADDDWEYEYSTEMETHLITLDLSIPEFVRHRLEHAMHNTRGGFRSWMQPLPTEAEVETEPGPEPGVPVGAGLPDMAKQAADDLLEATDIQILDLHGKQPVISYRDTVFTGVWTEPIGTEMIFADSANPGDAEAKEGKEGREGKDRQDGKVTYTAAARVAPDIDLLGASTARIACTPTQLRRRQHQLVPVVDAPEDTPADQPPAQRRGRPPKKHRSRFSIPVTGASAQRHRQAAFLEQLMALKASRGERDVVTVQAVETKINSVHDDPEEDRLRQKKAAQFVRYRRRANIRREQAAEAAEAAAAAGSPLPTTLPGRKRGRSSLSRVSGGLGDDGLSTTSFSHVTHFDSVT